MTRFYLALLAPALLCALLFSTVATALLATTPYSHIKQPDGGKCLFAPADYANGVTLEIVDCGNHNPTDAGLRFVFDDEGRIKIYASQNLCIEKGYLPNRNRAFKMATCNGSNDQRFTWKVNPSTISFTTAPRFLFTYSGDTSLVMRWDEVPKETGIPKTKQLWAKVDPTVKLLELDAGDACAQAPLNGAGDRYSSGQIFAAKCNVADVSQHFIIHDNGQIEVADGRLDAEEKMWCLDLGGGRPSGAWITWPCSPTGGNNQIFTFENARIKWVFNPTRVVGISNRNPAKPLLRFYTQNTEDFRQNWRQSLGDTQVMFKLAVESTNLCLNNQSDELKVSECIVDTTETCTNTPVDPAADLTQSFVLRENTGNKWALMSAHEDNNNPCVEVTGGGSADGTRVITGECDFSAKQMFEVDSVNRTIFGLDDKALTLVGGDQVVGTKIEISTWLREDFQKWDMHVARVPKCRPPTCLWEGGIGSTGVCVRGLCELAKALVYGGDEPLCCGLNGIDNNCLNEGAKKIPGIVSGNWCMTCDSFTPSEGLTGCLAPIPPPSNGTVPAAATHIRCSYNNLADNNLTPFSQTQPENKNLKYLALTGSNIAMTPLKLSKIFPNVTHLDLAGSNVNGYLFDSETARAWSQLEYANVSECTTLGSAGDDLFHFPLSDMSSSLRVLDMSAMGLSLPSKLASIAGLTSLEELYLNDNNLDRLPTDFFLDLLKLTKLRIKSNPMNFKLPDYLYTRSPAFDCDVLRGEFPASTRSPTTLSPTSIPTIEGPSKLPTIAPSSSPTFITPTMTPSAMPTSTSTLMPTSELAGTSGAGDSQPIGIIAGSVGGALALIVFAAFMCHKKRVTSMNASEQHKGLSSPTEF